MAEGRGEGPTVLLSSIIGVAEGRGEGSTVLLSSIVTLGNFKVRAHLVDSAHQKMATNTTPTAMPSA